MGRSGTRLAEARIICDGREVVLSEREAAPGARCTGSVVWLWIRTIQQARRRILADPAQVSKGGKETRLCVGSRLPSLKMRLVIPAH
jgi:hypothetical protein